MQSIMQYIYWTSLAILLLLYYILPYLITLSLYYTSSINKGTFRFFMECQIGFTVLSHCVCKDRSIHYHVLNFKMR